MPDSQGPPTVNVWSVDRDYRYTFFNGSHQAGMKAVWNAEIKMGSRILDFIADPEYRYLFFNNAHREAMLDIWRTEPEIGRNVLEPLPDPEYRKRVKNNLTLIHKALYQGTNLGSIQMKDYIPQLIESIMRLYLPDDKRIEVNYELNEVQLDIDRSIPMGIIVNELITNSMKYAFPEKTEGSISILLEPVEKTGFHIRVKDDGKGLPGEFDIEKSESLGMQLISALVSQLSGTVTFSSGNGLSVDIYF